MHKPVLQTRELTIGYPCKRGATKPVASAINVHLIAGELVCLLGPNGAGKSTLMRTLIGLQEPLSGRVQLMDQDLDDFAPSELARLVSLVLTERIDAGNLSAYALVALGRHPYTHFSGRLRPEDERVVRWAIEAVGARELAARSVNELSDGERQRIMIARALAQEPELLLLDEPTAFLDLPRRVETMRLLRQLAHETQRSILLSTHDLDLALRIADRVWLLSQDGTLHQGAPEDLVLSGAFQRAFPEVEFEAESGSFRLQQQPERAVELIGEGLPALWTRRALERAGFCTGGGTGVPRIEIASHNSHSFWRLHATGNPREYHSLYEVLRGLAPHKTSARP